MMNKIVEFILTTFRGRLVLFVAVAASVFLYANVAKAAQYETRCMIIGDSIAVGTKMFAPKDCVSYSKGGWNTWQWNKRWGNTPLVAKTIVISLGTNDHKGVKTRKELMKIRERIKADRVVWIMPPCNKKFCKPGVNNDVAQIASDFGDRIIGTSFVQPDGIHPSWRGYKQLVTLAAIR